MTEQKRDFSGEMNYHPKHLNDDSGAYYYLECLNDWVIKEDYAKDLLQAWKDQKDEIDRLEKEVKEWEGMFNVMSRSYTGMEERAEKLEARVKEPCDCDICKIRRSEK